MKSNEIILEGKRVKLIPVDKKHVEGLFKAVDSEEVWRLLPTRMKSLEDIKNIVSEAIQLKENGTQLPFIVYDKDLDEIVGMTRLLNISKENRNLEIGWTWYASKVWRTRVNTECKYLLLTYCFETLNTVRVQFKVDTRNIRSNNAVKRIGAIKEGVMRKERILHDGYIRDAAVYSIVDEEWPEIKNHLEERLID